MNRFQKFAFKFKLRRYIKPQAQYLIKIAAVVGRGLHSFTLELNLSNSSTHSYTRSRWSST
jgi:hypothetical protein